MAGQVAHTRMYGSPRSARPFAQLVERQAPLPGGRGFESHGGRAFLPS